MKSLILYLACSYLQEIGSIAASAQDLHLEVIKDLRRHQHREHHQYFHKRDEEYYGSASASYSGAADTTSNLDYAMQTTYSQPEDQGAGDQSPATTMTMTMDMDIDMDMDMDMDMEYVTVTETDTQMQLQMSYMTVTDTMTATVTTTTTSVMASPCSLDEVRPHTFTRIGEFKDCQTCDTSSTNETIVLPNIHRATR